MIFKTLLPLTSSLGRSGMRFGGFTLSVWNQAQGSVAVAVERFTSNCLEIYKQIPLMDDASSPEAQGLSTSQSSPEFSMVEMGFTVC